MEIDDSGWTGQIGQIIRVKALDDTFVAHVRVVIANEQGNLLEQGDASPADGLWWEYTATVQVSEGENPGVIATVQDLPGDPNQMTWQNNQARTNLPIIPTLPILTEDIEEWGWFFFRSPLTI